MRTHLTAATSLALPSRKRPTDLVGHQLMRLGVIILIVCALGFLLPGLAVATPTLVSPGDGAQVPAASQAFTWTDNYAEGPLDHWYMEISTSPMTDYYPFGYFSGNLVFSSTGLTTPSINLNAIGRALGPGTYYWHVVGYYGPFGSAGTHWTAVRSFTVQSSGAVAPAIAVNPASLDFTVAQGDSAVYAQYVDISNSGGGTLFFSAYIPSPYPSWLDIVAGTNTGTVYTLPVRVMAAGLGSGSYTWKVRIADNGSSPAATNGPVDVPVRLHVVPAESSPPTGISVVINDGAATTDDQTVTLRLSASDSGSGMGEMRFSNDGVTWSDWGPYATTKTWLLSNSAGTKTVRAQFRDKIHNQSSTVSDSIVYEQTTLREVAGDNRYETAIEASRRAYPGGADTVVIATGVNWPDALGGAALAGQVEGPLLLTKTSTLPGAVLAEVKRLGATDAYILGGPVAVAPAVQETLEANLSGSVTRLAGASRYSTANKVADEVIRLAGADFSRDAFIATGTNFPDALGASPLAASSRTPILLAPANGTPYLPSAVDSAVILGGPGAVSTTTENAVKGALGASNVLRIGGADRYSTTALIAEHGVASGMHWYGVGIATGVAFPDALSGGAMLGSKASVLLLTKPTSLVSAARQRLSGHKDVIGPVYFVGGTSAVNQAVRDDVEQVLE